MFAAANPKLLLGALLAVIVWTIGLYTIAHWTGSRDGRRAAETESITSALTIREKQNEIRNHRPDDR